MKDKVQVTITLDRPVVSEIDRRKDNEKRSRSNLINLLLTQTLDLPVISDPVEETEAKRSTPSPKKLLKKTG